MCRCRRSWRQDRLQDLQGELRFKLGSFSILNQSLFKRHIEALFRFARPWEPCEISFWCPPGGAGCDIETSFPESEQSIAEHGKRF